MQYLKKLGAGPTLFYPPDVEALIRLIRNGFPVLVAQGMSDEERQAARDKRGGRGNGHGGKGGKGDKSGGRGQRGGERPPKTATDAA